MVVVFFLLHWGMGHLPTHTHIYLPIQHKNLLLTIVPMGESTPTGKITMRGDIYLRKSSFIFHITFAQCLPVVGCHVRRQTEIVVLRTTTGLPSDGWAQGQAAYTKSNSDKELKRTPSCCQVLQRCDTVHGHVLEQDGRHQHKRYALSGPALCTQPSTRACTGTQPQWQSVQAEGRTLWLDPPPWVWDSFGSLGFPKKIFGGWVSEFTPQETPGRKTSLAFSAGDCCPQMKYFGVLRA